MPTKHLDVITMGNAIVDVLAHVEEEFLSANEIEKGAMTLIDGARAKEIYDAMPPAVEISGGSAGNTAAGIASFGGNAGYIGKVRDDQLGEVFSHDLKAIGVEYRTERASEGPETARCFILVTPDAQRSMNTFLGACHGLSTDDIDAKFIAGAKVLYMEGYLYDPPKAKEAFHFASEKAKAAGTEVSLTLSDSFCVDRFRDEFLDLIENHVDILFANEDELKSLYLTEDFDQAVDRIHEICPLSAVTRSEKGSIIITPKERHQVEAFPVDSLVDTTGAGDQYAAGFLYGYAAGKDLKTCGKLGSLAAAEVISHFGARPETPLSELARQHDL